MATRLMRFVQTDAAPPVMADPVEESRERQIARSAYFRAEARGFECGYELDDWLEAEQEVDARLADTLYRR